MDLNVNTQPSYVVHIEPGTLHKAKDYFDLARKCLILTDSGVPKEYAKCLEKQCDAPFVFVIPQGEQSKCFDWYLKALALMLEKGFSRKDCVVALGGGVCGDLAGFVASTYMRGIDFYNIPTTLLSMVDSSIGGKTAVDYLGYKNMVGTFYQPKGVLVDTETLKTLDKRQWKAGLVEAIKMAACMDPDLFERIEKHSIEVDEIVARALAIKGSVVEKDQKESGLRKVLNFGHTLGHAYEELSKGKLLHGEAVALGMIPMSSGLARERICDVLSSYGIETKGQFNDKEIAEALTHDKKGNKGYVDAIFVEKIGEFQIKKTSVEDLVSLSKEAGL